MQEFNTAVARGEQQALQQNRSDSMALPRGLDAEGRFRLPAQDARPKEPQFGRTAQDAAVDQELRALATMTLNESSAGATAADRLANARNRFDVLARESASQDDLSVRALQPSAAYLPAFDTALELSSRS